MRPAFTDLPRSIDLCGEAVPGADDRQRRIPNFDQKALSSTRVTCIGSGGIVSPVALTLVRKGAGGLTLVDGDVVEVSNLSRQRFFTSDIGTNKAVALARNLLPECIAETNLRAIGARLEEAITTGADLSCGVAICGVDNNPARVAASRYFRSLGIPVIFAAISRDGDHGYVFVQEKTGPCLGCVFPDIASDDRYPCPGTPAVADILLAISGFIVYGIDSLLMARNRTWNYRRLSLSDGSFDGASLMPTREGCPMCGPQASVEELGTQVDRRVH